MSIALYMPMPCPAEEATFLQSILSNNLGVYHHPVEKTQRPLTTLNTQPPIKLLSVKPLLQCSPIPTINKDENQIAKYLWAVLLSLAPLSQIHSNEHHATVIEFYTLSCIKDPTHPQIGLGDPLRTSPDLGNNTETKPPDVMILAFVAVCECRVLTRSLVIYWMFK